MAATSASPASSYLEAVSQRVVIFDGAMGTNLQLHEPDRRRLRRPGPRGVQRAAGGHPARRRRPGPPVVLRGRLRRGGDRHLRCLRPGPGRVRAGAPGPRAQPGRRRPWPDRRPTTSPLRTDPAGWPAASARAPSSPRSGRSGTPSSATPTRSRPPPSSRVGVDLIIIETVFDLLQAKAAINGARRAMRRAGVRLPIQSQVTIELTGTMLPGTEVGAALVRPRGHGRRRDRAQLRHRAVARCSSRCAT